MELIGRRLSGGELRAVLDDPAIVEDLLYGDLDDDAEMPEPELDLNKSWHVVHYLLTGTAWTVTEGVGEAVLGGTEIGEDGGYGPARLLDPATVRRVAAALDTLDVEPLRARLDPAAMADADIYPNQWAVEPDDFECIVVPLLADLCRFYGTAAANGEAALLVIT